MEKLMEELVRGQQSANQIRALLKEKVPIEGLMSSLDHHSLNVSSSLSNALSLLGNADVDSQDSGGESSRCSSASDRRGRYKRRKTCPSWTVEAAALVDDGHGWRKYGQKGILNAKHPRNYYRCTHKMDQGCQATKQVQRISDDPPLYRIIYQGHHTCQNPTSPPQLLLPDSITDSDSAQWISFDQSTQITNHLGKKSRDGGPLIKDEQSPLPYWQSGSPPSDYISGEMYSSTASPHSMAMDYNYIMGADTWDFDANVFRDFEYVGGV